MKKISHFMLLFFVIGMSNAQAPIYQFDFNNSLASSTGLGTLSYVQGGYSFVSNGQSANNAIQINNEQTILQVNLPNLPIGNSPRTVSVRINYGGIDASLQSVFCWGTGAANQAFGYQQSASSTKNYFWGSGDYNVSNSVVANTWYNMTFVYDGTNVTIYKDGAVLGTVTRNLATSGTLFKIGVLPSTSLGAFLIAKIDDLRIYNYALTQSQIQTLNTSLNPVPVVVVPVITNVSSSLIHEGANISYSVNAGGASTTTTVLYGQTIAASELAATGTTATGTTNTACTATTQYNLSAAAAGTTMYYRIQATNSVGTVFSPTFTYTQVAKPTYEVNAPTNITTSSSQINYTLKPNGGNSTSVVRYGLSASRLDDTATGFSALGFTDNFSNVQLTGLAPNTLYHYAVEGTNAYGISQSSVSTFTTLGNAPLLSMVNVSNIQTTSATVNFSLNTSNASTTKVVNYGTSSNNLNLSASGPTVTSTTATSYNVLLAGLTPNTTYYYSVVATNGSGTAASGVDQFTTQAVGAIPSPIYQFEFNNNLNSLDGSVTLNTPIGGSHAFVSNGTVSNGALELINARTQTSLPNLPLGSQARSVHLRVKFESGSFPGENYLFNWGTGSTSQAFAGHQTASSVKLLGWGGASYDYDLVPNSGATSAVWYEYMFVYSGTTMSVYRDGQLLGSKVVTALNTTGDSFRMGINPGGIVGINADIDYIRIFNQALTQGQVAQIYNTPSNLASNSFNTNLKFSLYPNPANSILNIDLDSEIKNVEIYSLLGQKVLSDNKKQVNISNLSSGVYMVKIEDINGNVATQKIVKE